MDEVAEEDIEWSYDGDQVAAELIKLVRIVEMNTDEVLVLIPSGKREVRTV